MVFFTSLVKCSPLEEISIAAAGRLASHLCFFIYGEHHMKASLIFRLQVVSSAALVYVEITVKHRMCFLAPSKPLRFSPSILYLS